MKRLSSPVDPVLRIPMVPVDSEMLVERAINKFHAFEMDRIDWIRRREEFYLGWDDYLSPIRKGAWDGASNVHLPLTEVQAQALHALMMQAVFLNYPWFYVDPQEDVDIHRIVKIERFMKYVLERYANMHEGIYLAIDDWAWDLVTEGMGILSRNWQILQSRFVKVVENEAFFQQKVDFEKLFNDTEEKDFDRLARELIRQPYIEQSIIRTTFNGPVVVAENPAYILFKGDVVDCTNLNEHQTVIKVCYFNRDTLLSFKQSDYADEEAVDQILDSPPDRKGMTGWTSGANRERRMADIQTGIKTINPNCAEDEWEVLCVFDRVNISGKNKKEEIADRVQYFVHEKTKTLLRWTYLDRISSDGKIPLHMGHLFRRPRRSMGRGVVQTMHPLNEVQDLLINQQIDAGLLANNPMFAFRGNSSFDPEHVKVEPGLGIKADDPNNDLRFFTWNVNPNWSLPIQGLVTSYAQQLTAIGPQQLGQIGPTVGALRSGAGVNALGANAALLHDVLIKRAKITISGLFNGLYQDCVERMPQSLQITVTGPDAQPLFDDLGRPIKETITREDLAKKIHFGLFANSQNLNREMQKNAALAIAQFSFQKLPVETGVVSPKNVYEIMKYLHQTLGTLRPDRFITEPQGGTAVPLQFELQMIMQGVVPPIVLADPEHALKVEKYLEIQASEAAQLEVQYGKVHPDALKILDAVIRKRKAMMKVLKKPSNAQNPTGSNQSLTLAQQGEEGGAGATGEAAPVPGGGDQDTGGSPDMASMMGGENG